MVNVNMGVMVNIIKGGFIFQINFIFLWFKEERLFKEEDWVKRERIWRNQNECTYMIHGSSFSFYDLKERKRERKSPHPSFFFLGR